MMVGILWALLATGAFAIVFNVRGYDIPLAAFGGALGWAVYLFISSSGSSDLLAYFASSACVALYAELVSQLLRKPATIYLVCALIPLVPGGGMYYTMAESLRGDFQGTLIIGFQTLSIAGSIASGVAISSAIARLAKRL
ncbi:threonine/serine exporter family protein [Treponema sp.]